MAKRKARKKAIKKVDTTIPLNPIDITKLGTDDDPCFGKHHDLTADECKMCGDSTICQIVCNSLTEKMRDTQEKDNRFKDLELGEETKEYKYITRMLAKNMPASKIIKKVSEKFEIDKKEARKFVKAIKK